MSVKFISVKRVTMAASGEVPFKIFSKQSSKDRIIEEFVIEPNASTGEVLYDYVTNLENYQSKVYDYLVDYENEPVKLYFVITMTFYKTDEEGKTRTDNATWTANVSSFTQLSPELFQEKYAEMTSDLARWIEQYHKKGSGWIFKRIVNMIIQVAKFEKQIQGGRTKMNNALLNLPSDCKNKRSLIKVTDNNGYEKNCFTQAVEIATFMAEHPDSLPKQDLFKMQTWKKHFELKNHKLKIPAECETDFVSVDDIYRFENENPAYFVTVIGYKNDHYYPVRTINHCNYTPVKNVRGVYQIFLFLYDNHYFPIKSLDGFLRKKDTHIGFHCIFCLKKFCHLNLRDGHENTCYGYHQQTVTMPEEGAKLQFSRSDAAQYHPIVIYADTESILKECHESKPTDQTQKLNTHVPCAAAYYVCLSEEMQEYMKRAKGCDKGLIKKFFVEYPNNLYQEFFGEDCMTQFIKSLYDLSERLYKMLKGWNKSIDVSQYESEKENATRCFICSQLFSDNVKESNCKVIDHCHWTGNFRGVAHQECNTKSRQKRNLIPVLFHNWKGYDCHSLCKTADCSSRKVTVNVIPLSTEKYLSLSLKWAVDAYRKEGRVVYNMCELRFMDTYQFLSCSLSSLINQLYAASNMDGFKHLQSNTNYDVSKMVRKGVYPYSYMDSFTRFEETELPPIECFKSDLDEGAECNVDDYMFAKEMFQNLSCQNLKDYMMQYLKSDVLLLSDVFENFRHTCFNINHLDPVFFYSLPGFSWSSALRQTGIQLDLMTDYEMYSVIERGIRGGLAVVTKHKIKAKNMYTHTDEIKDDSEFSKYIQVYDANSLYAWAMSQPLPTTDFKWLNESQFSQLFNEKELSSWPSIEGEKGYILVVDLEYPEEIHDKTKSYPLAPNHKAITVHDYTMEMFNQWQTVYPELSKIPTNNKLVADCENKENYVIHYRILKLYLQLGMKLTKIHQVIEFTQSCWLKSYIDDNIERRKAATTDFEKDFYKLCNNAVFGKTQEQKRKRKNFKIAVGPEETKKETSKDTYNGAIIFSETLVGIHHEVENVTLDLPIYCGFSILEISKCLMFEFFYDVVYPLFPKDEGESVEVIYTDTDSLVLYMKGRNIMEKMVSIRDEWIDGSNMDVNHPLYCTHNKGVIGKFKEEMNGVPITRMTALRPKQYCLETINQEDKVGKAKMRAKGVKTKALLTQTTKKEYRKTYKYGKTHKISQTNLTSKRHLLYTIRQVKKALSLFDNKRGWIKKNKSLPFGHYKYIQHQQELEEDRKEFCRTRLKLDLDDRTRRKQRPPYKVRDELCIKKNKRKRSTKQTTEEDSGEKRRRLNLEESSDDFTEDGDESMRDFITDSNPSTYPLLMSPIPDHLMNFVNSDSEEDMYYDSPDEIMYTNPYADYECK